jgi:transglutaminase-like putative cysteine protease
VEISLRYVTHFRYATPVWESHNSLRACPVHQDGQELLEYELAIEPVVPSYTYTDNWGTRVDTFDIPQPHNELVVTATARVATTAPSLPLSGPYAGTAEMEYIEREWLFLQPTRHTRWNGEIEVAAKDAMGASTDVVEIAASIEKTVRDSVDYRTGATDIGVDPAEIWHDRAGVCQDFAHLTISMLRSVGIAARYVSGYFYASDPTAGDSSDTDEILVATHAWVEVAVPGWGWWGVDPTNASPVGERHVKIGHGRDYDDVTPMRGVYYGDSDHHLAAEVTMSTSPIVRDQVPSVEVGEDELVQQ